LARSSPRPSTQNRLQAATWRSRRERGQREVLTGKAVGVVAADGVVGENSSHLGEEVSSSVPKLHMGSTDIRQCLIGDRKHRSESSLASMEVTRGMRGGGQSSCPMIAKPRAKEA
jgi:hypothetical protein